MAANPYAAQIARNSTGYPSYMSQPVPKKRATQSIYASPLTPLGSGANPGAQTQPLTAAPPAHHDYNVTPSYQTFDYTTDPILQQINAVSGKSRADADTAALAAKKQIAVKYGDPTVASQIGDQATADAATQNPYGAFTQLAQQHQQNASNLDENLNAHNLYYGGARIKQQGDLASQFGKSQADLTANEQSALGATDEARLAAFLAADQQDAQANQDAAMRALQQSLLNPPIPPAAGSINTLGQLSAAGLTAGDLGAYQDSQAPAYNLLTPTQQAGIYPLGPPVTGMDTAPAPQPPFGTNTGVTETTTPPPVQSGRGYPAAPAKKIRPMTPPPGALAQALAAGIKSARF